MNKEARSPWMGNKNQSSTMQPCSTCSRNHVDSQQSYRINMNRREWVIEHKASMNWGREKMVVILQTFWNAFSWMKMHEFRLIFHWILFLRVQLTIVHRWNIIVMKTWSTTTFLTEMRIGQHDCRHLQHMSSCHLAYRDQELACSVQ